MIVAGLGFRSSARSADIVRLVRRAEDRSGRGVHLMAVPEFKQGHAALVQALSILGLPLVTVSRSELERVQVRCTTRSAATQQAIGLGSVAEACALAALEEGGKLVLPRIASAQATCAIAIGDHS